MEFSSLIFLFLFLPLFLVLSFILKKEAHNVFLLMASLLFYAWGEGEYMILLLISITINYLLGKRITKIETKSQKRFIFILAIAFNLGLLIYFKYTGFILSNLGMPQPETPIHLPLGISFFTFQALSFIIDIYRQTIAMDSNPVHFGLYMTFFPKLITGPITPYYNLTPQIKERQVTLDDFAEGVKRFIIGLGKKVLIANTVARTADSIFSIPVNEQTAGLAWLGIISYTLQIYFDFSGYTDMAVGIGRMCGIKLLENFNYPYMAKSIKDFWTRWHISLAWWLRDYLFLPIAYAVLRRIKKDKVLNIKAEGWSYYIGTLSTFVICGIWHGANWTFITWGTFYGIILMIEHAGLRKFIKRRLPFMQILFTQFLVIIAWVFFRSETMSYAFSYLKAMFGMGTGNGIQYYPALYLDNEIIFFTLTGIVGCFPLFPLLKSLYEKWQAGIKNKNQKILWGFLQGGYGLVYTGFLTAILLASIMTMAAGTYNPFIYFRF